jgi:hypothetical protein
MVDEKIQVITETCVRNALSRFTGRRVGDISPRALTSAIVSELETNHIQLTRMEDRNGHLHLANLANIFHRMTGG